MTEDIFHSNSKVPINFGAARTYVAWYDLATDVQTNAGFVGNGGITLDNVDTTAGGSVELSIYAPLAVYRNPETANSSL